jgi:hypothetical protein
MFFRRKPFPDSFLSYCERRSVNSVSCECLSDASDSFNCSPQISVLRSTLKRKPHFCPSGL